MEKKCTIWTLMHISFRSGVISSHCPNINLTDRVILFTIVTTTDQQCCRTYVSAGDQVSPIFLWEHHWHCHGSHQGHHVMRRLPPEAHGHQLRHGLVEIAVLSYLFPRLSLFSTTYWYLSVCHRALSQHKASDGLVVIVLSTLILVMSSAILSAETVMVFSGTLSSWRAASRP